MKKVRLFDLPLEGIVWFIGLIWIMLTGHDNHAISFCFFKFIGLEFCPGCGLGHAIYQLATGNFLHAWQLQPMSYIALPILIYRIYYDFSLSYQLFKHRNHEQQFINVSS